MICKRIYLGLALGVFLFSSVAIAKGKDQTSDQPLTADGMVAKMKFQLELTDQQAQAVRPIIQNYLDEEKQLKVQEAQALKKVLTSDQMYTWNFLQTESPLKTKKKK